MKKLLIMFSFVLVLCLALLSCSNSDNIDTSNNLISDKNYDLNNNNIDKSLESINVENSKLSNDSVVTKDFEDAENVLNSNLNDTFGTSVKVENDTSTEGSDSEFPFDSNILERHGYDIVAAGKYYGNDFDNVKYYGSYYRIIDNYVNFSELTQWGSQIDESIFNENFILTLYSYTNSSIYYSHSNFQKLNGLGYFTDFKVDSKTDNLYMLEKWTVGGMTPDIDGYTPPTLEDYKVVFPVEKHVIIYLLIPKNELPKNLPINGEICLKSEIEIFE